MNASALAAHIESSYPKHLLDGLSERRLNLMVFTADWLCTLHAGSPITSAHWYMTRGYPVCDELSAPADDGAFLSDEQRQRVDHLVRTTAPMTPADFIRTMSGTYPMLITGGDEYVDLGDLAKRWHASCDAA